MKTSCYAQTNIGPVRPNNEDNYYCNGFYKRSAQTPVESLSHLQDGDGLLFALFDGMGGEACGEEAALTCARTMQEFQQKDMLQCLPDYYEAANAAVCAIGRSAGQDSGSTAVVAYFRGNRLFCSNLGDSRAYLHRGGTLRCLTKDHTKYRELMELGCWKPTEDDMQEKHVLTQYLGMHASKLIPHFALSVCLERGDRVLLCSDGLTGSLPDSRIAEILAEDAALEAGGARLVEEALAAGEQDNITVVLISVDEPDKETLPTPDFEKNPEPDAMETRRFNALSPEKVRAQQALLLAKRKRERRRETWLIILVTLGVVAVAAAIVFFSLYRTHQIQQANRQEHPLPAVTDPQPESIPPMESLPPVEYPAGTEPQEELPQLTPDVPPLPEAAPTPDPQPEPEATPDPSPTPAPSGKPDAEPETMTG